jgi:rhomboid domain-containing protein 1
MHNPRGRGRAPGLALYLLLGQMAQVGFDKIPPVTLALIAGQVAIFLQLFHVLWTRYDISSICISVLQVWYRDDWKRLLLATFFHLDEWHLYFNMISLLWKGIKLEKKFGSIYFFFLVAVFSVLVNIILVVLSICADRLTHDHSFITQCAAGFSGVLFALKVVLNDMDPTGMQYIMGLPVPSRLVCWAELILIHVMVPNASFLGHLSGIIAGLMYIMGPLKAILNVLFSIFAGFLKDFAPVRRFLLQVALAT